MTAVRDAQVRRVILTSGAVYGRSASRLGGCRASSADALRRLQDGREQYVLAMRSGIEMSSYACSTFGPGQPLPPSHPGHPSS